MIHRIRSSVNTYGLLSAFFISTFVLMMMFAFESSNFKAFAQNQSLPFSDIYSKQILAKINDKDHLAGMKFFKACRRIQQRWSFANYTRCRLQDR